MSRCQNTKEIVLRENGWLFEIFTGIFKTVYLILIFYLSCAAVFQPFEQTLLRFSALQNKHIL